MRHPALAALAAVTGRHRMMAVAAVFTMAAHFDGPWSRFRRSSILVVEPDAKGTYVQGSDDVHRYPKLVSIVFSNRGMEIGCGHEE